MPLAMVLALAGDPFAAMSSPVGRRPTLGERAAIRREVVETWKYRSEPLYGELSRRLLPRRPRLRPRVVRILVSGADPRFASAVVELRNAHRRRTGSAAVMVFELHSVPRSNKVAAYAVAGPAIDFPNACTDATPAGVRMLVCPDPWSVLGFPRPRAHAQTAYTQRIRSPNLHAIDWQKVALPGGVCGSSRPIRQHDYGLGPMAFVRPDVDLRWWNPVWIYSWERPKFGDLDGDGRDEAALQVVCANGGGTADGQLAFSAVIFRAVRRSLRVVGIVTPQQPFDPETPHVPVAYVSALGRGDVVLSEGWYGRYDGTCCSSGRARTTWTYSDGELGAPQTTVLRPPQSSPLFIDSVVAEPGHHRLDADRLTKVRATPDLRFAVSVDSLAGVPKRDVKVTLTIKQSPAPIVQTRTLDRIDPDALSPPKVTFGNLGPLHTETRTTVTIAIDDPGTFPEHYPVIFTRG